MHHKGVFDVINENEFRWRRTETPSVSSCAVTVHDERRSCCAVESIILGGVQYTVARLIQGCVNMLLAMIPCPLYVTNLLKGKHDANSIDNSWSTQMIILDRTAPVFVKE